MRIAEIGESVDEYFRVMTGRIQVKDFHAFRRHLLGIFMYEC